MKSPVNCPVCGSNCITSKFSVESYKLLECTICSLQFIYPFQDKQALKDLYSRDYFFGKLIGAMGYKDYDGLEDVLRKEALRKIKFIKKITSDKHLLDVGAGTGVFLDEAKKAGFQVAGNDISDFSSEVLKGKGIKFFEGALEMNVLPKESFEVVTAWDVLEHSADIVKMISALKDTLKSGGYIFITTPDTQSIDAKLLGKNWYGYKKIPEHLIFFNRQSVKDLLETNGFKVIKTKSWGFVRTIGFLAGKLAVYSPIFRVLSPLLKTLGLSKTSLFFRFTDFMVVARKK